MKLRLKMKSKQEQPQAEASASTKQSLDILHEMVVLLGGEARATDILIKFRNECKTASQILEERGLFLEVLAEVPHRFQIVGNGKDAIIRAL